MCPIFKQFMISALKKKNKGTRSQNTGPINIEKANMP